MFVRLFGETEEQQLHYLQTRVIITLVSLLLMILSVGAAVFSLVMMFVWGWGAVKAMFSITTVAAIFSGNFVFGVVVFAIYIVLSYMAGIICAALGIGRYIYLMIKKAKEKK